MVEADTMPPLSPFLPSFDDETAIFTDDMPFPAPFNEFEDYVDGDADSSSNSSAERFTFAVSPTPLSPLEAAIIAANTAVVAVPVGAVTMATVVQAANASSPSVSAPVARKAIRACVPCRRSKVSCDMGRPCRRCVRYHRAADCVDRAAEEVEAAKEKRKRRRKSPPLDEPPAKSNAADDDDCYTPPPTNSVPVVRRYSFAMLNAFKISRFRSALEHWVNTRTDTASQRRAHIMLTYSSNMMHVDDFTALMEHNHPITSLPHTSSLRAWYRPETRPFYFDWQSSPTQSQEITHDGADGQAQDVYTVPTIRIQFAPSASRRIQEWEKHQQQRVTSTPTTPDSATERNSLRDEMFLCLDVEPTIAVCPESERACCELSGCDMTMKRTHAAWCAVNTAYLESPTAPQLPVIAACTCDDSTPLEAEFTVNSAFENFFGDSQAQIRNGLIRRGMQCQSKWYTLASWYGMQNLQAAHLFTERYATTNSEFKCYIVIMDKHGSEHQCMLHKRITSTEGLTSFVQTFTPLEPELIKLEQQLE